MNQQITFNETMPKEPKEIENGKSESKETPPIDENKNRTEDFVQEFSDELNTPQWSVVSFEKCVVGNLTYQQATEKLNELVAKKVSGLCIITDEAAERIG